LGIIKQIKKMFSKNIDVGEIVKDKIFHFYTTKKNVITIGANIIVPNDFCAIFVCKDKITDILPQGKFAISGVNLPKTFKRMGLAKANKKGRFPKTFVGDIYFINISDNYGILFESSIPLKKTCKKYGKVKAQSEGKFDLKIERPELLLKYLLMDRAYVSDTFFNQFLKESVGDDVNKILTQSDTDFYNMLVNVSAANEVVNSRFVYNKIWNEIGLNISNIKVEFLNVNSKLKEKIDSDMRQLSEIHIDETNDSDEINENFKSQINIFDFKDEDDEDRQRVCSKCGGKVSASASFCERCGSRLSKFS